MYISLWLLLPFIVHAIRSLPEQSPILSTAADLSVDEKETLLLTFDDLAPSHGISQLPSPYPNQSSPLSLQFHGFSVFRPDHPDLSHLISIHDLNCAVSKPYAVLGSRYRSSTTSYQPSNDVSKQAVSHGKENSVLELPSFELFSPDKDDSFELRSLTIKPMDFPAGAETIIFLRGTKSRSVLQERHVDFNISFPAGYHLPLQLDMETVSAREAWTNLDKVEIWADYGRDDQSGYKGLDWEFCIDDVVFRI